MRLNPIPFWFLRHGETDWNAEGLSQGNTDIPLNHVGIMQARRAAKTLSVVPIKTIVCSPLSRAKDTAEMVAEQLKLGVIVDDELREVEFGEQEGKPMGDWYDDWIAGTYTPVGAETFSALRARAVSAINRATALQAPVLVVAHGALWRAFRYEAGLPANVRTPNALPLHVKPGENGEWVIDQLELVPEF
ncbi:histidine phosphatase family protein [Roseococcus sp. YIM B11640]|uniref:histidine phosphatase family protein n=1 Tax=Roseococcus sp. YIM B11640 TaxID=3133973 RepID=UPI003C79E1AF